MGDSDINIETFRASGHKYYVLGIGRKYHTLTERQMAKLKAAVRRI
jgi:hypothetical protein